MNSMQLKDKLKNVSKEKNVYLIYTTYWNNVNIEHFIKVINKTFSKRKYYENPLEALELIENSDDIKKRLNIYSLT